MESVKKIENINIYLISLLPFALAAGPAVIETIVIIIILLFFFSKKKIKFDKIDKFIFLFYLCLIISSIFSSFVIESLTSSIFLFRFILLYLIIRYYFLSEFKFKIINLTFIIICIVFIILIIDGYAQYFFKLSIFGTELTTSERMTMHFRKDEFIMGSYLSKMMPIFLGFWYFKFKNFNFKINFLITILTILTFYCMVLSNDRAATFLIIAFFIGLTSLYKFKVFYKFLILLTIIFSILITLTIFPSVKHRYIDTTFIEILGKTK